MESAINILVTSRLFVNPEYAVRATEKKSLSGQIIQIVHISHKKVKNLNTEMRNLQLDNTTSHAMGIELSNIKIIPLRISDDGIIRNVKLYCRILATSNASKIELNWTLEGQTEGVNDLGPEPEPGPGPGCGPGPGPGPRQVPVPPPAPITSPVPAPAPAPPPPPPPSSPRHHHHHHHHPPPIFTTHLHHHHHYHYHHHPLQRG